MPIAKFDLPNKEINLKFKVFMFKRLMNYTIAAKTYDFFVRYFI